jgi:hypothetical protein
MPICIGIACDRCGRVYFVAHPDQAGRIRFDRHTLAAPYKLTCAACRGIRYFEKREVKAYSVSQRAFGRGYAERSEYQEIRLKN